MKSITPWILFATASAFAEDTYRLRFRMEQSNQSRDYVLVVQNKSRGTIDATQRLPYYTNPKGDAKELHTIAVGNLIECTAHGEEPGVLLNCNLESSSVASDQPTSPQPAGFPPVIRSRRVKMSALTPIGREIRIARLSDASNGNPLEIFVMAERFTGPIDPDK